MATLTKSHRRQIPKELVEAVQTALTQFPAAAAAFVWAWEGGVLDVRIVIEDELAERQVCTRLIKAHFPDPVSVRYTYWKKWQPHHGIAGFERIYLRP